MGDLKEKEELEGRWVQHEVERRQVAKDIKFVQRVSDLVFGNTLDDNEEVHAE